MVVDATGTITIKVGTPPQPEFPWWLLLVASGLGVGTVAVVRSGNGTKKKGKKR